MKRLAFVLLAFVPPAFSTETKEIKPPKVWVFDLGGVFISSINEVGYARYLGLNSLAAYAAFDWQNPGKLGSIVFDVLNKVSLDPKKAVNGACTAKGMVLPPVICAYQAGLITSADARSLSLEVINKLKAETYFVSNRQEDLIRKALDLIFIPAVQAEFSYLIEEAVEVLKDLRSKRDGSIKIIALSNWDKESFALIKDKFKDFFTLFDEIIISADIHALKPNKSAYQALIDRLKVPLEDIFFVDDQKENIEAAHSFGIAHTYLLKDKTGFMSRGKDYLQLRQWLSGIGVMNYEPKQGFITKRAVAFSVFALTGLAALAYKVGIKKS